jgi:hypothetical protein
LFLASFSDRSILRSVTAGCYIGFTIVIRDPGPGDASKRITAQKLSSRTATDRRVALR